MCLYVYGDVQPKVAEEDIKVYKVLEWSDLGSCWETPFRHEEVNLGRTYKIRSKGFMPVFKRDLRDNHHMFGSGMFHSYKLQENAKRLANLIEYYDISRVVVVEAIIPKGTEYITGRDDDGCTTYGSKVLRYTTNIIKTVDGTWRNQE